MLAHAATVTPTPFHGPRATESSRSEGGPGQFGGEALCPPGPAWARGGPLLPPTSCFLSRPGWPECHQTSCPHRCSSHAPPQLRGGGFLPLRLRPGQRLFSWGGGPALPGPPAKLGPGSSTTRPGARRPSPLSPDSSSPCSGLQGSQGPPPHSGGRGSGHLGPWVSRAGSEQSLENVK